MAVNLKVNAKSKILDFKKKHNLLVEKMENLLPPITESDIGKVLGVNNDGELEFQEISGGTKLYKHTITGMGGAFQGLTLEIISLDSQPYNSFQRMLNACDDQLYMLLNLNQGSQKVKLVYMTFNGSYFKMYFGGYYTAFGGSTDPGLITYELGVSDITPTDVVTEL